METPIVLEEWWTPLSSKTVTLIHPCGSKILLRHGDVLIPTREKDVYQWITQLFDNAMVHIKWPDTILIRVTGRHYIIGGSG